MGSSNYVFPGMGLVATLKAYCDFLKNYVKTKMFTSPLMSVAKTQKSPLQIDDFVFLPDQPILLGKENILSATSVKNVIKNEKTEPTKKFEPKADTVSQSDDFVSNPFFQGNFID